MPAHRRKQTNAMLYTLITVIGLLIAATTVAIIFYVKAEEYRIDRESLENELSDFATRDEQDSVTSIIGAKANLKTWIGTMVDYLDNSTIMIFGGVPAQTSAEVKIDKAIKENADAIELAQKYIDITEPNTTGLTQIINSLTAELENTINQKIDTQKKLENLQKEFEDADKASEETKQKHLAKIDMLEQDVNDIQKRYNDLSADLEQTTDQELNNIRRQLEQTRADYKTTNAKLLETNARLKEAREMLMLAKEEIAKIEPGPNRSAMAYEPDGKIVSVDNQANIVSIDVGIRDHVYRGLTFTVYNRGTSVTEDGQGKCEIEVFDIAETYSLARIIPSETNKPLLEGDIIANLVWDSEKVNVFVAIGDFDFDNDGYIDSNANQRLGNLVEKWGGRLDKDISIDTDFLIVGQEPKVLPVDEENDLNLIAEQNNEDALERLNLYNDTLDRAESLWIPVFNYDRFLYFIGYTGKIDQAGSI
jgi:hypothetical protein